MRIPIRKRIVVYRTSCILRMRCLQFQAIAETQKRDIMLKNVASAPARYNPLRFTAFEKHRKVISVIQPVVYRTFNWSHKTKRHLLSTKLFIWVCLRCECPIKRREARRRSTKCTQRRLKFHYERCDTVRTVSIRSERVGQQPSFSLVVRKRGVEQ